MVNLLYNTIYCSHNVVSFDLRRVTLPTSYIHFMTIHLCSICVYSLICCDLNAICFTDLDLHLSLNIFPGHIF